MGKCVLIVLKHLFESVKVEAVPDVILIDSAEKGVVFKIAEPANPAVVFFGGV